MIAAAAPLQTAGALDMRAAHDNAVGQQLLKNQAAQQSAGSAGAVGQSQLREKFDSFVGESFYGQMLQAMHKTVGKVPYFNGGRAEEMFQGQLDQVLSESMSKANGGSLSEAMFDLFNLQTTGGRK